MVINKASAIAPQLPREAVPVAAFGGDVIVRGLKLSERLALRRKAGEAAQAGNTQYLVTALLAVAVEDVEGQPIYTADEWDAFGSKHEGDATKLFNAAYKLSGFGAGDHEKN